MTVAVETTASVDYKNPFPGLRPFRLGESHLFFGREKQTEHVIRKLHSQRFVAIIGASGVGKSSFVSCGILPELLKEDGPEWKICSTTPGSYPLLNFARALVNLIRPELDEGNASGEASDLITETVMKLAKSPDGLVNILKDHYSKQNNEYSFLIFIDQFEEIFRFSSDENSSTDQVSHLVKIILHAIEQADLPVYVALSIRSDFIGDCAKYPSLTAAINDSQYLIPQLVRDEKRRAITGPIQYVGASIDEELVEAILNDVGENADQLPVMQHALMRTWDFWQKNSLQNEAITTADYEAIGGMRNALSEHAREAYRELTEDEKVICERIYKTITEKGDEGRGVRRPTKLKDIADIAQTSTEDLKKVIELFRRPDRTLLMPPSHITLSDETMIDISHESLMRNWVELVKWVEEEAESVKLYLRLAEAAEMHQEGKTGLWRPPDLQLGLNWLEEQKPTEAWGLRHHKAWERTMLFLEYSRKETEREQRIKEKLQKRRLIAARVTALILGMGIVVALLFLLYAERQRREADKQRAEAAKQKEVAEEQAIIASKNEKEALTQKKIAEIETDRAVKNEQVANQQRKLAEKERHNAVLQTIIADSARQVALMEEREAYRLRLLSIAKSMAIKSLQVHDSIEESLVARQAYNFYSQNGGKKHDPDIYDGMYYALKRVEHPSYNSLIAHTQNVRSLISDDQLKFVFSTGSDGKLFRWNSENPQKDYKLISDNPGRINRTLALSHDRRRLACAGDFKFIEIYDVSSPGKKPEVINTNRKETWYVTFTPDGSGIISIGSDNKITLHKNGELQVIAESDDKINAIALSPDGSSVVAAKNNGELVEYKIKGGAEPAVYAKDNRGTAQISVAFSPDGNLMAAGTEKGTVRLYDYHSRRLLYTLPGHTARINNIVFSFDNARLATGSFDKTVRLWNLKNLNDPPIVLKDHNDWVWSIVFNSDNSKLLAGCRDYLIRLWPTDMETMAEKLCEKLSREMKSSEWEAYVGDDIPYEKSCSK